MKYILMHKRAPVAEIEIDDASCSISRIYDVYAPLHMPVGVSVKQGLADRTALNSWWKNRAIPISRDGIRNALDELKISSTDNLLDKCLGLSLSDQYWICPKKSELSWDTVNFFNNSFSEDVGNILFGKGSSSDRINLMSPDSTSDGWLKKKWKIINSKRCLLKGGSGTVRQEPYNEALASAVMRRLNIPHVDYTVIIQDEFPYSVCEDFITPETELITAFNIMQTQKKENHISVYQHYLNCCEALGIHGAVDFTDKMLTLDYLIVNEDRHLNNFGVIRNAETLEYIGMAPIYDNGTSMWFSSPVSMIRPASPKQPSKPFKTTHSEQIKLVQSFEWLDLSALNGIEDEYREIMKDSDFIDAKRRDTLCFALKRRVELLADEVREHEIFAVSDIADDVERNIAYAGTQNNDIEDDLEI